MSDFQFNRVIKQIGDLKREQEQLVHSLMRVKRDEQFETERLHREYTGKISAIENRQNTIKQAIRIKEQELLQIKNRQGTANIKEPSAIEMAKQRRHQSYSR